MIEVLLHLTILALFPPLLLGVIGKTKAVPESDEERLAQLGYTQVLARRMSAFSNYAVSFTITSVLSGGVRQHAPRIPGEAQPRGQAYECRCR